MQHEAHELFMKRCFDLAVNGAGRVAPNPLVGAVLVHENNIIGEGFHEVFGGPHAEVNAINVAKKDHSHLLKTATLYVNLEPCCHHGKTPPCTELILRSGIKNIVISNVDANAAVHGKGIEILRGNGCNVITGILENEGTFINRRFFTFHELRRPYIVLKWAQSADGFFTKNIHEQHWITGAQSKTLVHKWRAEEAAVMVGTRTALTDDPRLTVRLWKLLKQPVRIVLDRELELPSDLQIFNDEADTLVFNEKISSVKNNVQFQQISFDEKMLIDLMENLHERKILSVMVEGGTRLLQNFIKQGLWDEARIFTGNVFFSCGIPAPTISGNIVSEQHIGDDRLRILSKKL